MYFTCNKCLLCAYYILPLRVTVKSKGNNIEILTTYWAPSKCSVRVISIIVTVILTGGRGMGILFPASFFLTGGLGHLNHEGHCFLLYSVRNPRSLIKAFGDCGLHDRSVFFIDASFVENSAMKHLSPSCSVC